MLTHAIPIESQFKALLPDNLNAEIVLGSVSNVKEAVNWLTYTYLAVRMRQNPLVYGISFEQLAVSAQQEWRHQLLVNSSRRFSMLQG
jgi:replicative superfamily II helicase